MNRLKIIELIETVQKESDDLRNERDRLNLKPETIDIYNRVINEKRAIRIELQDLQDFALSSGFHLETEFTLTISQKEPS